MLRDWLKKREGREKLKLERNDVSEKLNEGWIIEMWERMVDLGGPSEWVHGRRKKDGWMDS